MGAIILLFPPNQAVLRLLPAGVGPRLSRPCAADPDAALRTDAIEVDIAGLEPLIARPGHPEDVVPGARRSPGRQDRLGLHRLLHQRPLRGPAGRGRRCSRDARSRPAWSSRSCRPPTRSGRQAMTEGLFERLQAGRRARRQRRLRRLRRRPDRPERPRRGDRLAPATATSPASRARARSSSRAPRPPRPPPWPASSPPPTRSRPDGRRLRRRSAAAGRDRLAARGRRRGRPATSRPSCAGRVWVVDQGQHRHRHDLPQPPPRHHRPRARWGSTPSATCRAGRTSPRRRSPATSSSPARTSAAAARASRPSTASRASASRAIVARELRRHLRAQRHQRRPADPGRRPARGPG